MTKEGERMTGEKIKEEFEKWIDGESFCTDNERRFYEQFNSDLHPISVGFYAGFRAAERLAKIEVLEDILRMTDKLRFFSIRDYKDAKNRIEVLISELKAGQ